MLFFIAIEIPANTWNNIFDPVMSKSPCHINIIHKAWSIEDKDRVNMNSSIITKFNLHCIAQETLFKTFSCKSKQLIPIIYNILLRAYWIYKLLMVVKIKPYNHDLTMSHF